MLSPEKKREITVLNDRFNGSSPEEVLKFICEQYGNKLSFASSLGAEDQVITHMLSGIKNKVRTFTLDTGRLFPETLNLLDNTNKRYGIKIEVYFPDKDKVEKMVNEKGINLFYDSVENRKECCNIRKILSIKRALKNADAWISGLRAEQSVTRHGLSFFDWDANSGLLKISPLIHWSEEQVWDYIRKYNIPYNKLHDEGYPSIGCQPCTRAIGEGEDIRAGRWWWEQPDLKECGLHGKK
jgi:phosphoadenosine phosphosulfate reductase